MVCSKNSCAGGYGNCLDVKITNACNARCAFCIEKDGYNPEPAPVKELALATIQDKSDTVLILGGEPTLYPDLIEYLKLIRPWKERIYLTTNGSQLTPPYTLAKEMAKYLDGINISIHHYSEYLNDSVYDSENCLISFRFLKKAIGVFHESDVRVRFNTNLVRGILDSKQDVERMIAFAAHMGADEIRFAELQNSEDLWVDAKQFFPTLPDNPFEDGCECEVPNELGITVRVKTTCGRVNRKRPPVNEEPVRTGGETHVLYANAQVSPGWLTNKESCSGCEGKSTADCHCGGCHGPTLYINKGCH